MLQGGLISKPAHFAQEFVQSHLGNLQGWRLHNISGQPDLSLNHYMARCFPSYPTGIYLAATCECCFLSIWCVLDLIHLFLSLNYPQDPLFKIPIPSDRKKIFYVGYWKFHTEILPENNLLESWMPRRASSWKQYNYEMLPASSQNMLRACSCLGHRFAGHK